MPQSEKDFFRDVLESIEGLPEGLSERLQKLLEEAPEDRPEALRLLVEEHSGD